MKEILKKKSLIAVVILGILSITVFVLVASNSLNYNSLVDKGFVLSNEIENPIYFEKDTKIINKFPNSIEFKNNENEEEVIKKENFIHYDVGLSSFVDGVVLDTNTISNEAINYYSVESNTILDKLNNTYTLETVDNSIGLTDFVYKISDNKYLVNSSSINGTLNGSDVSLGSMVEFEYKEGNIITITTQKSRYNTISSDAKLQLANGVGIDLASKNILQNSETKMNLSEMIIDSAGNIDALKDVANDKVNENKETSNESNGNKDNTSNPQNNTNSETNTNQREPEKNNNSSLSNVIGGMNKFFEDFVSANSTNDSGGNSSVPQFILSQMNIDAVSLSSVLNIIDPDSVLNDGTTITVTEFETNKKIYEQRVGLGSLKVDTSIDILKPNTKYLLVVNGSYTLDGIVYNNDFLQREFTTNAIGLQFNVIEQMQTSLNIKVNLESISNVTSGKLVVYDGKNEEVYSTNIDMHGAKKPEGVIYEVTGLSSNSEYTVEFQNVMYNNLISVKDYKNTQKTYTLKDNLLFGDAIVGIDKLNSNFSFGIKDIQDPQKGIKNISFVVYVSGAEDTPVYRVDSGLNSNVVVNLADTPLKRNISYVMKAEIDFFDNAKNIIFNTALSTQFMMDGTPIPEVTPTEEYDITNNSFKGKYTVNTNGSEIVGNEIKIELVDNSNNVQNKTVIVPMTGDTGTFDIEFIGLRSNETQKIVMKAAINLNDGNVPVEGAIIGSFTFNTLPSVPFNISYKIMDQKITPFEVGVHLENGEEEAKIYEHQASTLKLLTFKLYKSSVEENIDEPNFSPDAMNLVGTALINNLSPDWGQSSLKKDFYDNQYGITPATFLLSNDQINEPIIDGVVNNVFAPEYVLEVVGMQDQALTPNEIPINSNSKYFKVIPNFSPPKIDVDDAFNIGVITNNEDKKLQTLSPETVTKYELMPKLDNTSKQIVKTTTRIFEVDSKGNKVEIPALMQVLDYSTTDYIIKPNTYEVGFGTSGSAVSTEIQRGREYIATIEVEYDTDGDGITDVYFPTKEELDAGQQIKSIAIRPRRNEPYITGYFTYESGKSIFNYNYYDVDFAISNRSININGVAHNLNNTQAADSFGQIELTNDQGVVKVDYNKLIDFITAENISIIETTIENPTYNNKINYSVSNVDNNLVISILDNNISGLAEIDGLVNMQVEIIDKSNVNNKLVLSNIISRSSTKEIKIPLTDLSQFVGKRIIVNVTGIYKGGNHFDKDSFIISDGNSYFTIVDNVLLSGMGSDYINKDLIIETDGFKPAMNPTSLPITVKYKNFYDNKPMTFDTSIVNGEIDLLGQNISIYGTSQVAFESNNKETSIDSISPIGIITSILPGLNGFTIGYTVDDTKTSKLVGNTIFVKVVSEDGTEKEFTIPKPANNDPGEYIIDGLLPNQNYKLSLYGNITENGVVTKGPLYDNVDLVLGKEYHSQTIANINSVSYKYANYANSSSDKGIKFDFSVDGGEGINYVTYSVKDKDGNDLNLGIQPTEGNITSDFSKEIPFDKIIGFLPNTSDYTLDVGLFVKQIGVEPVEVGSTSIKFNIEELISPTFVINPTVTSNSIDFRTIVNDEMYTIRNGRYRIKVSTNGNELIIPGITDIEHSVLDVNSKKVIPNLSPSTMYKIDFLTFADLGYNNIDTEIVSSVNVTTNNQHNINVGDIFVSQSLTNANKIDLSFFNFTNLDLITSISYTIFKSDGSVVASGSSPFTPIINGTEATYNLPYEFTESGAYMIQFSFNKGQEMITNKTITTIIKVINTPNSGPINFIRSFVSKMFGGV